MSIFNIELSAQNFKIIEQPPYKTPPSLIELVQNIIEIASKNLPCLQAPSSFPLDLSINPDTVTICTALLSTTLANHEQLSPEEFHACQFASNYFSCLAKTPAIPPTSLNPSFEASETTLSIPQCSIEEEVKNFLSILHPEEIATLDKSIQPLLPSTSLTDQPLKISQNSETSLFITPLPAQTLSNIGALAEIPSGAASDGEDSSEEPASSKSSFSELQPQAIAPIVPPAFVKKFNIQGKTFFIAPVFCLRKIPFFSLPHQLPIQILYKGTYSSRDSSRIEHSLRTMIISNYEKISIITQASEMSFASYIDPICGTYLQLYKKDLLLKIHQGLVTIKEYYRAYWPNVLKKLPNNPVITVMDNSLALVNQALNTYSPKPTTLPALSEAMDKVIHETEKNLIRSQQILSSVNLEPSQQPSSFHLFAASGKPSSALKRKQTASVPCSDDSTTLIPQKKSSLSSNFSENLEASSSISSQYFFHDYGASFFIAPTFCIRKNVHPSTSPNILPYTLLYTGKYNQNSKKELESKLRYIINKNAQRIKSFLEADDNIELDYETPQRNKIHLRGKKAILSTILQGLLTIKTYYEKFLPTTLCDYTVIKSEKILTQNIEDIRNQLSPDLHSPQVLSDDDIKKIIKQTQTELECKTQLFFPKQTKIVLFCIRKAKLSSTNYILSYKYFYNKNQTSLYKKAKKQLITTLTFLPKLLEESAPSIPTDDTIPIFIQSKIAPDTTKIISSYQELLFLLFDGLSENLAYCNESAPDVLKNNSQHTPSQILSEAISSIASKISPSPIPKTTSTIITKLLQQEITISNDDEDKA